MVFFTFQIITTKHCQEIEKIPGILVPYLLQLISTLLISSFQHQTIGMGVSVWMIVLDTVECRTHIGQLVAWSFGPLICWSVHWLMDGVVDWLVETYVVIIIINKLLYSATHHHHITLYTLSIMCSRVNL